MVAVASAATLALIAGGAYSFQRVVAEKNHALSEEASARAAENTARQSNHELVFQQARSSLAYDPTATIAWLKGYPAGGPHAGELGALIDEATSLGVARHVLRHPEWVMGAGYDRDGRLVSTDLDGRIVRWNLETGQGTVIAQHAQKVWSGKVSPDGTRMAVGGQEGLVGVYSLTGDGKPVQLEAHELMVEWLQFSADGRRLLTWNKGNQIQVWDTTSGEALLTFGDDVTCGAIHPDGQTAFVGLDSGEIVRVGIDGKRSRIARFATPTMLLHVSPAGDRLLAHDKDGTLRLVEVATGKARVLGEQPVMKAVAAFSHSGDLVATGGIDAVVHVFSTADAHRHDTLRGHDDTIYQLEFAPDGSYLASASDDGTARIWDLSSLQSQVLRGHEDDVNTLAIRADGRELVTTSLDKSLRVWPVGHEERVLVGKHGVEIERVGFTGDGARIFAVGKDRVLRAWDLATGEMHERPLPEVKQPKKMYATADREVRRVAIPRDDGSIDLWDVASGKTRNLRGHQGPVAVAMSKDGNRLVSSDKKGTTLVWDLTGDQPSSHVLLRERPLLAMSLSADGKVLVASEKGRLFSIDPASGKELASIDPATAGFADVEPYSLSISPDGGHVLAGTKNGVSLLWTVADGAVRSFGRPGYHINQTEFSLDGRWLAASMTDRTVILWNLATGRSEVLKGHRDLVFQVAFSRDGETLASASYDRTVRLWDAETGRPLRVLRGHSAPVQGVAFSPDDELLASGAADGTVRLWDMTALPSDRPDAVRARLERATTSRIADGRAATLTRVRD
jgi:WD40 repeat protein